LQSGIEWWWVWWPCAMQECVTLRNRMTTSKIFISSKHLCFPEAFSDY
jgi:hypothetical protein